MCLRNFVAQYGRLGTGKMARLRNFARLSPVGWSRHRKDGVPKKLCVQEGGLGTGKMVCLRRLCSVRWSRRRKDGVPKKLCVQ